MSYQPAWMESIIDVVANCMEPHGELALGYRWRNEDDYWEIWVYPTPAELVGGAADGTVVSPGFSLDVQGVSTSFEELEAVQWRAQPFGPHDQDGEHLSFEGVYDGHDVWLLVLSQAPDDEEPGFRVDLTRKKKNP